MRFVCVFLFLLVLLAGCGETKEQLFQEAQAARQEHNLRGAVVYLHAALKKDPAYREARQLLARIYLDLGQQDHAGRELEKLDLQGDDSSGTLLLKAEMLLQDQRTQEALQLLEQIRAEHGESADLLDVEARCYAVLERWEKAENAFRQALVREPQRQLTHLNLCRVLRSGGDLTAAQRCLVDYTRAWPNSPEGVVLLAQAYGQQGNPAESIRVLEAFLQKVPHHTEAAYLLASFYLQLRRYDAAQKVADALLERKANHSLALLLAGRLKLAKHDYATAIDLLTRSLQQNRSLAAEFFLGLAYLGAGQWEQALNSFQAALDLSADFVPARLMLATTLMRQQRYGDALTATRRILETHPDHLEALRLAAMAHIGLKQFDEASRLVDRAVALHPDDADTLLQQGTFEVAMGDLVSGKEALERAVQADPENLKARVALILFLQSKNDYQAALEVIQAGLRQQQADAVLLNLRGGILLQQQRTLAAKASLKEALSLAPAYRAPAYNLARIYRYQGEWTEALGVYEQVLSRDGSDREALRGKAQTLLLLGRKGDAQKAFEVLRDTGDEQGYLALALFYLREGQPQDALAVTNEGLVQFPQSVSLLLQKAASLEALAQPEQAVATYLAAESVRPGAGLASAVDLLAQRNQVERAQQVVADYASADPESAQRPVMLSLLLERQGRGEEALSVLQQAMDSVRDRSVLYRQMMRLQAKVARPEEQLATVNRWLAEAPADPEAFFWAGVVQEKIGDIVKAEQYYERALRFRPDYVPALNNLAFLCVERLGKADRALGLAQRAVDLEPVTPEVLDTLGVALGASGQWDSAVEVLRKAFEGRPQHGDIGFHLARALKQVGHPDEAREILEKVRTLPTLTQKDDAERLYRSL